MNLVKLQNEIAEDEGIKYELYLCSESHLTGGIGHLITEWDIEYYGKPDNITIRYASTQSKVVKTEFPKEFFGLHSGINARALRSWNHFLGEVDFFYCHW